MNKISLMPRSNMTLLEEHINGDGVGNESEYGMTPLHVASYYGDLNVLKALLWAGADINSV